ncbi:MAG: RHS repeat-associated core domain-containing protein, partial [Candidatus Promineifilaceae bacterium]
MTTSAAAKGSVVQKCPFGKHRALPTTEITDRGFTGHKHNNLGANDLGLIYMNARYFVPAVGRFASADTIVPNPANPQSFNRYTYALNSPINLVDPTGHGECSPLDPLDCSSPAPPPPTLDPPPTPLVNLDQEGDQAWTPAEQATIEAAAWNVA